MDFGAKKSTKSVSGYFLIDLMRSLVYYFFNNLYRQVVYLVINTLSALIKILIVFCYKFAAESFPVPGIEYFLSVSFIIKWIYPVFLILNCFSAQKKLL